MDAFSAGDLKKLMAHRQGPCVSVFMPTHAAGRDGQQDALRLKNLLAQAERSLVEQGMRAPDARKLLEPVRDLPHEPNFWEKRSLGLAVFRAAEVFDRFRVPLELDEAAIVNWRFQVKPLLPLLSVGDRFFLLTLSQNRVRFFTGNKSELREVAIEGLPENMEQALNYDMIHPGTQFRTGVSTGGSGKRGAVFHGQGIERSATKEDLGTYFRMVDAALHPTLREVRIPLILAGVQYLLPIYREVSSYPAIAKEELPGNADHLNSQELHAQALPLIQAWERARRDDAVAKYRQLAGTGRTADQLETVLQAASQGQVEILFVDRDSHCWGAYDNEAAKVRLSDESHPGADDLLDLAASQTLLNRGSVYSLPREDCPAPPVCAVLRY